VNRISARRRRALPDAHPCSAVVAEFLWRCGRVRMVNIGFDDATLAMFREANRIASAAELLAPSKKANIQYCLASNLEDRGEFAEGLTLARAALSAAEHASHAAPQFAPDVRSLLGACLTGQHDYAAAEPLLIQAYQELLVIRGAGSFDTRVALNRLVRLLVAEGRAQDSVA